MSCEWTEAFLESKYEEALEFGLSEEEAAVYARECLEEFA